MGCVGEPARDPATGDESARPLSLSRGSSVDSAETPALFVPGVVVAGNREALLAAGLQRHGSPLIAFTLKSGAIKVGETSRRPSDARDPSSWRNPFLSVVTMPPRVNRLHRCY